jgi:4'-phosphopantetheinyl transferase
VSASVDVIVVSLAAERASVDDALAACSADERERAARFRADDDRARFVIGRALLRRWCALRLGCSPHAVAIALSGRGKPYVPGTHFAVNVAHGGDRIVLAAGDGVEPGVGVDVEALGRAGDVVRAVERIVAPEEAAAFAQLPATERLGALLELWVRKEAVLKAEGTGLAGVPHAVQVAAPAPSGIAWLEVVRVPNGSAWSVVPVDAGPDHAAAVAVPLGTPVSVIAF